LTVHTYRRGRKEFSVADTIGEKADDLAAEPDKKNVMDGISEDVVHAIPAQTKKPAPLVIRTQPWQEQPWIGGAYAFYRPGQWFTIRPILQKPHGRVLFAGEHLADWQGFMEGAVNTGEAAAGAL
jgi:monoamine oxidase